MKKTLLSLAMSVAAVVAAPAQAFVVGTADTGSSFPFGSYLGGYYFQQIYSAASFGSALTITDLTFYTTLYRGGRPSSGTFDLYLSTSNADVASFDTSTTIPFADPSYTPVFSGVLPSVTDNKFQIRLTTPFTYDPAAGNLMLTVRNLTLAADGALFLDADNNVGVMNLRFSAYPYNINQGLVTGFNEAASAVPEPASWALMIGGLGLAGATARRQRALQVRFG